MTASIRKRPRPAVLLSKGIQRALAQPTAPKAVRAALFVLSHAASHARNILLFGLPSLPRILTALHSRSSRRDLSPTVAVDIYTAPLAAPGAPVVLYVHGGAWGMGSSWNFAPLGRGLADLSQSTVLVLSYPMYPHALMAEQAASVACALRFVRDEYPDRVVICLAHSSGAHISALALLDSRPHRAYVPLADVFIAQAGVFDLGKHFLYEASRGLAVASPLAPAVDGVDERPGAGALADMSPAAALERPDFLPQWQDIVHECLTLEGDAAAVMLCESAERALPPPGEAARGREEMRPVYFPQVILQAATADLTVPTIAQTGAFYSALVNAAQSPVRLLLYEGEMNHESFVTDWFTGGDVVDREARREYLDSEVDAGHREDIAQKVYGSLSRTIDTVSPADILGGPSAQIRDICRIMSSITGDCC